MGIEVIRKNIEEMVNNDYEGFVKALISFEKGIEDEGVLNILYYRFMGNDDQGLLSEEFDDGIDN